MDIEKVSSYVSRFLAIKPESLPGCFAPAEKGDLEKVIRFRQYQFSTEAPWDEAVYLKWRYTFTETSREGNDFWVFKKDGEILGCVGIEKIPLIIDKKRYDIYKPMDLLVKPEVRGVGLGLWMHMVLREKFPLMLAIGSNKSSYPIIRKVYRELRPYKVYKLLLSARVPLKRIVKSDLLSNIIAFPLDHIILKYYTRGIRLPAAYSSRVLDSVPDEVNGFGDQANRIYIPRDKEYLTWRYINNPRRKYIVIGLYEHDSLKAVSVCTVIHSTVDGRAEDYVTGYIVDWLLDETGDAGNLKKYLYNETVRYLKKQKVKLVHASVTDDRSAESLADLGFIKREDGKTVFARTSKSELKNTFYNSNLWALREGDSDTDLF